MYSYQSKFPNLPSWLPALPAGTLAVLWRMWAVPYDLEMLLIGFVLVAGTIFLVDLCIQELSPGARVQSRFLLGMLLLSASAYVLKSGAMNLDAAEGALAALLSVFYALRAHRENVIWWPLLSGLFAASVYWFWPPLLVLSLPFALWGVAETRRNIPWLLLGLALGGTLSYYFLDKTMLRGWSVGNFLQPMAIWWGSKAQVPQILSGLFPFLHPGFFILMPALFLFSKKTDWILPSKRLLIGAFWGYLLLVAGLSEMRPEHQLPAYLILVLLIFPAWDRFISYGFFFFPRLTYALLALGGLMQVCGMGLLLFR